MNKKMNNKTKNSLLLLTTLFCTAYASTSQAMIGREAKDDFIYRYENPIQKKARTSVFKESLDLFHFVKDRCCPNIKDWQEFFNITVTILFEPQQKITDSITKTARKKLKLRRKKEQ